MMKKLLSIFVFTMLYSISGAQSFSNITTASPIPTSTTDFSVTFDFSGISAGDTMEWQIKTSNGAGDVDWASDTVAYGTGLAFDNTGSGNQTVTISLGSGGGSPTISQDQELIWFGKISDSGNTELHTMVSPVFTVSNTAGISDINENGILVYPNPTSDKLYIHNSLQANQIKVIDISGRTVLNFDKANNIESIDVTNLTNGIYFLRTDLGSQLKFLKK